MSRLSLLYLMVSCLIVCVLITQCTLIQPPSFATVTATQIIGPDGAAMSIAWIDDWIVVAAEPAESQAGFATTLWRFHPDGSALEQLAVPALSTPACAPGSPYGFGTPKRLPNGHLGYVMQCRSASGPALQALLMAFDLNTETSMHLREEPLPYPRGSYSWNPTMTRGIAETGTRLIEEQLYWFTPTTSEPYTTGFTQAAQAEWSPSGDHIAFVAATSHWRRGQAQLDSVFRLYMAQTDGSQIKQLVGGFRHPGGLAWSPDGHWLVLSARFGENEGLWLVDATSGDRQQLTSERYTGPSWAPDGNSLAAFVRMNSEELMSNYRIIRLDLTWHTDDQ